VQWVPDVLMSATGAQLLSTDGRGTDRRSDGNVSGRYFAGQMQRQRHQLLLQQLLLINV
jgi:hypothetical protein